MKRKLFKTACIVLAMVMALVMLTDCTEGTENVVEENNEEAAAPMSLS